jgi:hypothetical protein
MLAPRGSIQIGPRLTQLWGTSQRQQLRGRSHHSAGSCPPHHPCTTHCSASVDCRSSHIPPSFLGHPCCSLSHFHSASRSHQQIRTKTSRLQDGIADSIHQTHFQYRVQIRTVPIAYFRACPWGFLVRSQRCSSQQLSGRTHVRSTASRVNRAPRAHGLLSAFALAMPDVHVSVSVSVSVRSWRRDWFHALQASTRVALVLVCVLASAHPSFEGLV